MSSKRPKQTVDTIFQFINSILEQNPAGAPATENPTQKDGALNMAAILASLPSEAHTLCFAPTDGFGGQIYPPFVGQNHPAVW